MYFYLLKYGKNEDSYANDSNSIKVFEISRECISLTELSGPKENMWFGRIGRRVEKCSIFISFKANGHFALRCAQTFLLSGYTHSSCHSGCQSPACPNTKHQAPHSLHKGQAFSLVVHLLWETYSRTTNFPSAPPFSHLPKQPAPHFRPTCISPVSGIHTICYVFLVLIFISK